MLSLSMTLVTQLWWWPADEKVGGQVPVCTLWAALSQLGKEG